MTRRLVLIAALVVVGFLIWPYAFTVVPIDEAGARDDAFDAVTYVDEQWSEIEATIRDDAVDLAVLLAAMAPDAGGLVSKDELIAVTEQFGLVTPGEAHVYKVRATGTVTAVDTDSSVGTMTVAVEGYDGPIEVQVYLGPRIPSDESSIRDAVGFISFGDFRDQTEYGNVASEINDRVADRLATIDAASLEGQEVTVYGAMTIRTFNLVQIDVQTVNVVPIAVEVG